MQLSKRNGLFIIVIAWALIHVLLLFHFGIVTKGEAEKYIREANHLISDGTLTAPSYFLYLTQIGLIYLSMKLQVGFWIVIAVQLVFSLAATASFYRLSAHFFNPFTALIATFWFLANLPLQQFNVFLQTDSLFYSFTVIFSCYLLQIGKLNITRIAIIVLFLLLISVTRPTGLFFIAATFLYFYFKFLRNIHMGYKMLGITLITGLFLYFLNAAIGSGGELDFMLPARDERIICGVPTLPQFIHINETANGNSIYGLFYYITHNFSQFTRLAFQRSVAFFGLLRPHYSTVHQVYLFLLFFPAYVMAAVSLKYWIKNNPFMILYFFSLIFFTWVTVILSCDDWHNRFFLTVSPYITILSLPAIHTLFSKIASYERRR